LVEEPQLNKCQGIPRYIEILAGLLEFNSFETINIGKEIPKISKQQKPDENASNSSSKTLTRKYNSFQHSNTIEAKKRRRESKHQKKLREKKDRKQEKKRQKAN
jgi:hypothetical protein